MPPPPPSKNSLPAPKRCWVMQPGSSPARVEELSWPTWRWPLLGGSAQQAKSRFGWNRDTVELGLRERASGITCVDNFAARGNKRSEAKRPELGARHPRAGRPAQPGRSAV